METKKLEFGSDKCKKIHGGKQNLFCPELHVNNGEEKIKEVDKEKYLGDILSKDGKNDQTIAARKSTGMGIVTQILLMLDEVSLGSHYFEIGLMLREAMLVNGLLFNAEIWYGLTKKNISELEEVDKLLLRKILKAHSKTPVQWRVSN